MSMCQIILTWSGQTNIIGIVRRTCDAGLEQVCRLTIGTDTKDIRREGLRVGSGDVQGCLGERT